MKNIFIFVQGGLGNQLFQAALGIALEQSLGVSVRFLTDSFVTDTHGRSYLLDAFPALRNRVALPGSGSGIRVVKEKDLETLIPEQRVEQIGAILAAEDGLVLDGYWQDERYWNGSHDLIRQLLRPEVSQRVAETGATMRSAGTVGMHVRRGDYGHHGLARSEYYVRSLAAIRAETGARFAFYATDEPNFCRFEFRGIPDLVALPGNTQAPFDDFYLLSSCRHFVIANSSFSWWAAFLGEQPGSVVYAPQPFCIFDPTVNPVPARWRCVANAVQRQ